MNKDSGESKQKNCATCTHFHPILDSRGRCKKNAPKEAGDFPVVMESYSCGDFEKK